MAVWLPEGRAGMQARGRGRPRQTTHDEIRDIARELFAANGYASTSLEQIAEAAGISRTTLFGYFPAKQDLVWEEFDAGIARMRAELSRLPKHSDQMAAIVAGILATARYSAAEKPALIERWRLVRTDPQLRAAQALRTEELAQGLVHAVVEGFTGGDLERVDRVVRALMAVAACDIEDWTRASESPAALDDFLGERIAPFADALHPLLSRPGAQVRATPPSASERDRGTGDQDSSAW